MTIPADNILTRAPRIVDGAMDDADHYGTRLRSELSSTNARQVLNLRV